MESTQRVAWPCVVDATFRFPETLTRPGASHGCPRLANQTAARFVVEPLIGPREAAGTRGAASAITREAREAWVRTCSLPMMTGHR